MIYHILLIVASFVSYCLADVEFTGPTPGQLYTASGGSVSVPLTWDDSSSSGDELSLENVKTYTILICAGGAGGSSIQCLTNNPLYKGGPFSSNSYTVSVPSTLVPSGYFYFQFYTTFTDGSTTINYSPRVQLQGMTGPTSTLVLSVTGDPPGGQTSIAGGGNAAINSASFSIPYTLQTGKTRFAPMQTQPGPSVTVTTWSMRFPTSAVTYYSAKASPPWVLSTITPGWDYSAESAVNWASAAPFPTAFYPASERVSSASLSGTKKKRWL